MLITQDKTVSLQNTDANKRKESGGHAETRADKLARVARAFTCRTVVAPTPLSSESDMGSTMYAKAKEAAFRD